MYYYQPPQSNPSGANSAQMLNWEQQRQSDEALDFAEKRYKGLGWDPVNVQRYGNCFRVHMVDRDGEYHTITMDGNGNVLQNQAGYQ